MKAIAKKISTVFCALLFSCPVTVAQQGFAPNQIPGHVFDPDSLKGFDEVAATRSAIDEHFTGTEFPLRMHLLKRRYINEKYNLVPSHRTVNNNYGDVFAFTTQVPACSNEDFEASTSGTVTASNQVAGWTVTRGSNNPFLPGQSLFNSCNLLGCCPSQPVESAVFSASSGYVDPVIGSCYPIYSVFGSTPGDPVGVTTNSHLSTATRGNNFFRLNSNALGTLAYSVERLSKTFTVTPNSALFQFAFIAVFSTGHGCCDAGAFQIRLFRGNCTAQPTLITCPSFTASALSSQCTNTVSNIAWLNATGNTNPACSPASLSSSYIFNKWQVASMDLSSYIGDCITIEVVASDCTGSGHYGYVYFDAQCGPMTITGNGTPFPAGTPSMIVPTCGASGATMCATPGIGSYAWAGPNVPASSASLSPLNQCYTSSLSATYTLTMQPPGGCPPIVKVITTTITPAPLLASQVIQATCGQSLAIVSVTPGGSAGSPSSITWWPPPFAINGQTTQGTYIIPPGPAPTIVSVTASDPLGCLVTATQAVLPAPPIPDFTVQTLSNTYTISCYTPSVALDISTTYTYGTLGYFWASNSFTSTSTSITVTSGGVYTVTGTDPVTKCATTRTVSIGINTLAPLSTLTPSFQTINCNTVSVTGVTATANPSINITHNFYSPLGGNYVANTPTVYYLPATPGPFTHVLVNNVNGCQTVKIFTVASSDLFPTFTLISIPGGYTLGCNSKSVIAVSIASANAGGGSIDYAKLDPGSVSGPVFGSQSVFNLASPGSYTFITRNINNGCQTRIAASVLSNTFKPAIDVVEVPFPILSCYHPNTRLKTISTTPNVSYSWNFSQVPGNQAGDTLSVYANFSKPTTTVVDNFTTTVTDMNSTCTNFSIIPIKQNLFPPKALITTTTKSLTCAIDNIELTNFSSTTIPPNTFYPGPAPGNIIGKLWRGPTPQLPKENSSTYVARMPGEYTLTAEDSNNGCTTKTILTIFEDRVYPIVNNNLPMSAFTLDCGASVTSMSVTVTTALNNLTYEWTGPGTHTTTPKLVTNRLGEYNVTVTNTVNACFINTEVELHNGVLTADFSVDHEFGYAPHAVGFENLSSSSLDNKNIVSVWSLGNGNTTTVSSIAPITAVYNAPGDYTITMFVTKGSCQAKKSQVIQVEIPSQIIVPNVFTPNGDGSNDLFILQRSNKLYEIDARIFDRWGHLVYELSTEKGQIEWDGRNRYGKELPEGTYFYVITAKGKDGIDYDKKGYISLLR